MSQLAIEPNRPLTAVPPPSDLPSEDGVPLESDWHRLEMNLLLELLGLHFQGREDYFAGGNMFIYFDAEQFRDRNFRGPDFFFVKHVPLNPPRPYWALWEEGGKYPNVIIELTSPSTAADDRGIKKETYEEVFRTPEYFIYDPATRRLQGWRLNEKLRYRPIFSDERNWLWSEQLELWLGTRIGKFQGKEETYLRFFDKEGKMLPSAQERVEAEKNRAETEKARADALEAELAALRAHQNQPKA